MKTCRSVIALVMAFGVLCCIAETDALRQYYEKQKAELARTFVAPQLGAEVKVALASGQPRTGLLMKVGEDEITVLSESGDTVVYKRHAMKESTRAQFFAEDHAQMKALEKTRAYKNHLLSENLAAENAHTHEGSLSVSAKVEKSSDKTKDVAENKSKRTGEKRQTTKVTRTSTEVQTLVVTVSNPITHPDTYTLEHYFFSEPVSKGQRNPGRGKKASVGENDGITLKAKGSQIVSVPARGRQSVQIQSEPFQVVKVETSTDGYSHREPRETGEESAGYIVILKHGTRVLDMKASAKSYLNEEWLRKFR